MRRFVIFGCLISFLASDKVRADWQYTKWGMTADRVVAASGGAAVPVTPEDVKGLRVKPQLKAAYQTGTFSFTAFFFFDNKDLGLNEVRLDLKDHDLEKVIKLRDAMLQKYGKPGKEEGSMTVPTDVPNYRNYYVQWWTESGHVAFSYSSSGSLTRPDYESVAVTYSALHWAENDGL